MWLGSFSSDLPEWVEFFVNPGYGLACDPDNVDSIASALRWFLENPQKRRKMAERGRQKILSDWNYETQFEPVLRYMKELNR